MKLTLSHRNHAPSKSIIELIEKELKSLLPDVQIDEAKIHLERSLTDSPPFSASFHLVTPGPDIIVRSSDHTLRAAVLKAFERISEKIDHRHAKRSRRRETAPAIELTRRRPSGGLRR
jgi:ribosome-associated translation inhibitor RaiA